MLTDPKEIEIISKARQPNVRDPKRKREPFNRIFEDFLSSVDLNGRSVIDLGPGQFDFCTIAEERGASNCTAIDIDPAVVALGRHRGYTVSEACLQELASNPIAERVFDGVFCKYSFNAFWYVGNENEHRKFLDSLTNMIGEDGWSWLSPWNGVPRGITENSAAEFQRNYFIEKGFSVYELDVEQSKVYGVHGKTYNRPIFTRNLPEVSNIEIIHSTEGKSVFSRFLRRLFSE
ncbi:MAG: class I SAM-dependent methyltransferase [Verrucomicrobiales bacterium]|nr:class I SAM-dependent methyltransferase [Verrucomicrobiales bacterium]